MQTASTIKVTAADFESVVLQNENTVLVDFWAEWCGPCRMMNPVLDSLAADHEGRLLVAKINVDEEPELAQRFGIRSIPTLLVFKDGALQEQFAGMTSQEALEQKLNGYI